MESKTQYTPKQEKKDKGYDNEIGIYSEKGRGSLQFAKGKASQYRK